MSPLVSLLVCEGIVEVQEEGRDVELCEVGRVFSSSLWLCDCLSALRSHGALER